MNILLANPNTTPSVTDHIAAAARSIAAPGTTIIPATAPFGAAIIGTRTEMAVAEHAAVTLLAQAAAHDGAIIGASLDSGLHAAREMLRGPVIGITEAALHTACLLGARFGIVALSPWAAASAREMVAAYGLATRLAGLRWLDTAPQDLLADPGAAMPALLEAARHLVRHDLADTIVLIGAVMAGMPARLQPGLSVPVLEGVTCAVPLIEGLVRLRLPPRAPLPHRLLYGVDPALQARFGPP